MEQNEVNQEMSTWGESEQPPLPRKKNGFKKGLLTGLFCGILITCLIIAITVQILSASLGGYLVLGNGVRSLGKGTNYMTSETSRKMAEIMKYVDTYYTGEVDESAISDELEHSLVEALGDPYSSYYTKEEFDDLQVNTTGEYYGIGAGLSQDVKTMVVTITKIYAGTPSEEAGLKKDDIILYVDGIDATSMELSKLVQNIRGEEGTTVHIQVLRDQEVLDFDVERRNVTLPSVEGQLLEQEIGYIQISEFQEKTSEQFRQIFTELEEEGMKGVILDVRSNPGGMLSTVVDMLDFLLPEGTVVYMEDKYEKRTDFSSDAACVKMPMIVLMDGNSASASEIFAGALKDYAWATLIGTTSFGKGIVQSIFPLQNGDALKITTAKYFTPNGNYIHGKGIDPDIEVPYEFMGGEEDVYAIEFDNQIQRALEEMRSMMAE